jgi:hypothetical protein
MIRAILAIRQLQHPLGVVLQQSPIKVLWMQAVCWSAALLKKLKTIGEIMRIIDCLQNI